MEDLGSATGAIDRIGYGICFAGEKIQVTAVGRLEKRIPPLTCRGRETRCIGQPNVGKVVVRSILRCPGHVLDIREGNGRPIECIGSATRRCDFRRIAILIALERAIRRQGGAVHLHLDRLALSIVLNGARRRAAPARRLGN